MQTRDVMNHQPPTVSASATFREAAAAFTESGATDLVVVDDEDGLVGVLSEGDLLRALFPNLDELTARGGSMTEAFAAFLQNGGHLADQPIGRIVIRDPIVVEPTDPLLRVATVMASRQIRRLPVVEGGKVAGTVSRADICAGALGAKSRGP
jgi:CBS domain-containing protein